MSEKLNFLMSSVITIEQRWGDDGNNGFILIPVLFTLALLALASIVLTRTVATDLRENANSLHRAQAEALGDGITRLAIRYLVTRSADGDHIGAFALNGTPIDCSVRDGIASIAVNSTSGLVDLNLASEDVLEALFSHVGASDPKSLAAAVIDFRDLDSETSPGGAEAPEYLAAGVPAGPKNAPFQSVEELDQVLGMTRELLDRARPMLTTRSKQQMPDLTVATADVLALALPAQIPNRQQFRSLSITVHVRSGNFASAEFTRRAEILLEPRIQSGFLLKEWHSVENMAGPNTASGGGGLPPCMAGLLGD